jgi:uncharacterized protein (DUF736 family)
MRSAYIFGEEYMVAIGFVRKRVDGSYAGELRTLTIHTPIEIRQNQNKANERQPDFRVYAASSVEIGTARRKVGENSQAEYISLSLSIPEFGPKRFTANLGPIPGQDSETYAIIWNPDN